MNNRRTLGIILLISSLATLVVALFLYRTGPQLFIPALAVAGAGTADLVVALILLAISRPAAT